MRPGAATSKRTGASRKPVIQGLWGSQTDADHQAAHESVRPADPAFPSRDWSSPAGQSSAPSAGQRNTFSLPGDDSSVGRPQTFSDGWVNRAVGLFFGGNAAASKHRTAKIKPGDIDMDALMGVIYRRLRTDFRLDRERLGRLRDTPR